MAVLIFLAYRAVVEMEAKVEATQKNAPISISTTAQLNKVQLLFLLYICV